MKANVYNKVKAYRSAGYTWSQAADALNDKGWLTPRGNYWKAQTLQNAMYEAAKRYAKAGATAETTETASETTGAPFWKSVVVTSDLSDTQKIRILSQLI